jgi:hypothetical protein
MSQENVAEVDDPPRRCYKRLMRGVRVVVVAVALAVLPTSGGGAVAANAKPARETQPTLRLVPDCETFADWDPPSNSVRVLLSGFPPNTQFHGMLVTADGAGVSGNFRTDANGTFDSLRDAGALGSYIPGTWTATIVWAGGTLTSSLYVDCSKPATKQDCNKGGWRRYGFENQGQCVRLVRHGPK